MKGTVFYKMSGSGNDFIFLDGRTSPADGWAPERIRALCAPGTGVGADGLVVLEPGSGRNRVRFHFFNSDGLGADMCGNGALCATRLAAWLELAAGDGMILETDAGQVEARCVGGPDELAEIVVPRPSPPIRVDVPLDPGEQEIHLLTVCVPHIVVLVDDVGAVPLVERGRALREHPAVGPAGANVNFAANGGAAWAMRTYERGVEAETLACGTGAVAVAAVVNSTQAEEAPDTLPIATASGSELVVSGIGEEKIRLQGEGRLIYRGILGI